MVTTDTAVRVRDSGPATASTGLVAPVSWWSTKPPVLMALVWGALAAAVPLAVCLVVALFGWFAADMGAHGTPRDSFRVATLTWLSAHGSTVTISGVVITMAPLALTFASVWVMTRMARRVGELVAHVGPDAEGLANGERDWTVAWATTLYLVGYVALLVGAGVLASTPETNPNLGRAVVIAVLFGLAFAFPAIATGSGRMAVWLRVVPAAAQAVATDAVRVLKALLWCGLVAVVIAVALNLGDVMTATTEVADDPGAVLSVVALSFLALPNAVVAAVAWLVGPGFSVGTATLVSPGAVSVGPLPLVPLIAAVPTSTVAGLSWVVIVPAVLAAYVIAKTHWRSPRESFGVAAIHGVSSGVLAALAVTVLCAWANGAIGPGRMQEFGPAAAGVFPAAAASLGLGGLVAALAVTALARR